MLFVLIDANEPNEGSNCVQKSCVISFILLTQRGQKHEGSREVASQEEGPLKNEEINKRC